VPILALALGIGTAVAPRAQAGFRPAPMAVTNPPVVEACGLDLTLVLDASGSIQNSNAVDDVRDAADAFLTALKDTNSTARVIDFGTVARETAPTGSLVTTASLASGGVHRVAINKYYNPKPPIQSGVTPYEFRSGNVNSTSSYRVGSTSNTQYTNWDQALDQAGRGPADLIVFITDGDPTAVDSDQPGDPFYVSGRQPPNVRYNMSNGAAQNLALDRAVEEADAAKTNGSRILAVGVGSAITSTPSVNRLRAVAGPNVARTIADFDITTTDVTIVEDFEQLGAALRGVVTELCAPSFTIRKLAQSPASADYEPIAGWDVTVEPTVVGGGVPPYEWILPQAGLPVGPVTRPTDANGFVQFQWEPNPPEATSLVDITEATGAPYTPVDYRCEVRDIDGNVTIVENTFNGSFSLSVDSQDIVTCTLRNAFDYAPAIAITKSDSPTVVRGDLDPPAQVVSTFVVTNTGNADLSSVSVHDDTCAPVTYSSGDTNADGVLQTTETWTFTCTRDIVVGLDDAPVDITNTATVDAIAPNQLEVSDTDDDTITAVVPVIDIQKTVRPAGSGGFADSTQLVGSSGDVDYRMVVTNPSNVPLGSVTVTDPLCDPITGPTGDTDSDTLLDTTETWTYTCTTTVTGDTVNVATVEGTPVLAGLGTPNPPVSASDDATVSFVEAGLDLSKTVDIDVALPGDTATYTYTVTNTGAVDLVPLAPSTRADLVVDDLSPQATCTSPAYVSGDTGNDSVLSPAEAWTYTCSAVIDADNHGINVARASMLVDGTSTELNRLAVAKVDLETAAITVVKDSLRPVVLDLDATAIAGPDVPLRAPAVYQYSVRNHGTLPLDDVTLTDDVCASPTFESGDSNGDTLLDVDEVWIYVCVQTDRLTKADGVPASDPVRPSVVTNTGTATGTPVLSGTPRPDAAVSDTDTATTTVIAPAVSITKTPSAALVREGDDVTYTYRVRASGDTPVAPIGVVDDLCSPVEFVSGDTNSNDIVELSEVWTYTCTAQLFGPSPVTNTAAVLAAGGLGNLYFDETTATVEVFGTDIALDKSVSDELVLRGSTVTYTFEVSNAGTDPVNDVLDQIVLADVSSPANASCNSPTYVSGDTDNDDTLAVDEVWTYTCTGVIDELTVDLAGVQGTDVLGGVVVDFDTAVVAPFDAGISVVKTANVDEVPQGGGPVTYTYEVRNTGNVPLRGVMQRVTDDKCADVQYVTGDDGNALLTGEGDIFETGGPEVWIFECTTTVTVDTVNTVTAVGTPVDPATDTVLTADVSDTDQATVIVTTGGSRPPTTLPETGFDATRILWIVLAILGLGAAMTRTARRHPLR
jgi:uncharacterized repeat protein (TIGR01451 family)